MLRKPLDDLAATGREVAIQYTDVSSGFDTKVQIAFFFAMLVSKPGVALPDLGVHRSGPHTAREVAHQSGSWARRSRSSSRESMSSWSVLPNIVRLMASFQPPEDAFFMNARTYLDFTTKLMLAVGVGFVLPVLLVLLNFLGVLRGMTILKQWRIAIIAIITFAAITTAGDRADEHVRACRANCGVVLHCRGGRHLARPNSRQEACGRVC